MRNVKGFTIVEVLISAVLIAVLIYKLIIKQFRIIKTLKKGFQKCLTLLVLKQILLIKIY